MKILQLVQSFLPMIGGMELVVHHLSNALVQHGHEVVVLAAGQPGAQTQDASPNAESGEALYAIRIYDFGRRFGKALGRNRRSILRAIRQLREEWGFDLVHAHTLYYPGYCALVGRRRWGYPLVVTEHGMFAQVCVDGLAPAWPSVRRKMVWTARHAPCLTAPGRETFDLLMRERPAATVGLSRVVPNGVAVPSPEAIDAFESATSRESARILMVGRNNPVKGYDVALRAFARLRSQGVDARLAIVGAGSDALADDARALGIADCVDLLLPRQGDSLWRMYASASAFWLTSRRESFGLAKFEAMCFGLPGVYNDAPGVREEVRDGENGLLFKENDAADLAEKTATLLRDPALRRRLSAAARETGDRYRWECLIGEYETLYEKAVGSVQ